jgi:hypothetical protein
MKTKKLTDIRNQIDFDVQLMATELDVSVEDIRCLSNVYMEDSIMIDRFHSFIQDIEQNNGVEITSFDDNTIMYEYANEVVVIQTILEDKWLLFDKAISTKIQNIMFGFDC